jgi:ATP/maltotriose-dependent transcriptional regulator MalT
LMTLLGWFAALPEDAICKTPQLCRDYGWALTLTGQLDEAEPYLQRAEAAAAGDGALLGTIIVAQAYNLRVRGKNDLAVEHSQRALSLLPPEDQLSRSLVAITLGLAYWNRGNFPEAEAAFIQVDQAAQRSNNQYARMTALTYLGMIQAVYGRLRSAAELCRRVIQLGGQSPTVAPAQIELGALLYEWNDLETAAYHLQAGIEQSQQIGNLLIQSDGLRTLALVQQARGEPDLADATLQKADRLAESRQVSPLTHMRQAACHVQLALAQNNLAEAEFWAGQMTEEADSSLLHPPRLGLTPARLLLSRNEKIAAADKLQEIHGAARQSGWISAVVSVRALQALAAIAPAEALQFLKDAL